MATLNWAKVSKYADHAERGQLLLAHAGELSDGDYWRAVAEAWQDSDRQGLTPANWRKLWTERPGSEQVMTNRERAELASLPERVQVFRGFSSSYDGYSGISWSLDSRVADWFACRRRGEGLVISAWVLRKRILAIFNERKEQEVVVLARYVYDRRLRPADEIAAQRWKESIWRPS